MRQNATAVLIVCFLSSLLLAETPATGPSSKPEKEKETLTVKRGSIDASIDADGYFEAVDPLDVRIRPRSYQGELTILSVAAHGAKVKAGDSLLEIDPKEINRQIAVAENELLAAQANADKSLADCSLGQQGDDLAMKVQQDELDRAEKAIKWFDDVDGKHMLKSAELGVAQAKYSVEDQQDELEQLKKMYKSEELTSATADIVVKRALRNLELTKVHLGMQQERQTKVKEFDFTGARQKLLFALDKEKQELAQLQATQAQSKVLRQTAQNSTRAALEKAQQKAAELKEDLNAFNVKAPSDGVVLYGQIAQGQWQNGGPRALRVGEKVQPGQGLMTVVAAGKVRFVIDVPEAKVGMVKPGLSARVVPTAFSEATSSGLCGMPSPTGSPKEPGQVFATPVDLTNIDPRLMPGEKGSAHVDVGTAKDVLLVPVAAVQRGRVRTPGADGKDVWKDVVCGVSDGENVEIRSGLSEGDEIYPKAAK